MFTLRQSLSGFRYYQQLIREVDDEIESQMGELRSKAPEGTTVPERTKKAPYQRRHYEPATFDLRAELYRVFGVDLTDIPGIGAGTAQTILCELGTDISHFPNASAFASWLGLCPERRITGGKLLLSTKTRRVRNHLAMALRMGASSLHHADNYLGECYRRLSRRLGKPQAVTATAHKIARILFHLLSTREPSSESVLRKHEEQNQRRNKARLRKQVARLGFALVPAVNL